MLVTVAAEAQGVSTGRLHVLPSSRLNIMRLVPLRQFSRMMLHNSLPSGERKTYGSQGFLRDIVSPSKATVGSLHVRPPSRVMLCMTW